MRGDRQEDSARHSGGTSGHGPQAHMVGADERRSIMLRYGNDALLLFDGDYRVLDCNDRALEVFGYAHDELIGLGIDAVTAEQPDVPLTMRQDALRQSDRAVFEGVGRRKDGSTFPIETSLHTVRTEHGLLYHAAVRDITERVRAESRAQENEQRLQLSLAAADAGTWEWDLTTDENSWSKEVWALYGLDPAAYPASYAAWLESVRPEDREGLEALLSETVSRNAELDFEWRVNTRDGEDRWIHSHGSPEVDEHGTLVRYCGVVMDVTGRKRAEAAAQEERAKLDVALSSMTDAVSIFDAEGELVDFNDAFVTVNRFERRKDCVRTLRDYPGITEVLHPDGAVAALEEWPSSRALRGEIGVDEEFTVRRTDTGEVWVGSYSFSPLPNAAGEVAGAVVVARDITERREMEQSLRASEAEARETVDRLSRAQELGHIGDWEWDIATGEGRWSEEIYRIYGVDKDFPTTVDAIVAMVHPDERPRQLARMQEILDDPERGSGSLQLRIVRPDGRVRHVFQTLAVERDDEGRALRVFGLQQDVTELRETEEALIQSERRLRRIYDAGLVGVVYWTAEGSITDANDRFLEMVRYSRAELEAGELGWAGLTPPEWDARDRESLEELRATGRNRTPFAKEYFRKDGSRLPILTAAAAFDDEATEGIALIVDISEQKRAQADLRRLNLELEDRVRQRTVDLEAANAELESFSYSVSHDLRAPLRHIAGFAELLREHLAEVRDEEAQHFIDVVTRSAGEMSTLIDDLLRFSRVGRAEMHVELVDMGALVHEVLEVERAEPGERCVEVTVGKLPSANGDRTLLRQVWANLLDNAVKYTRPRATAVVEIGAREEGPQTVYWVRDNGVGFEMQYADRLFRVFERLHRSDEFEGTGIGLANVGRIVSRHGGRCWAEASVNEGATFYFSLPRAG